MFKIELGSVRYRGGDIGNDIVFTSEVQGLKKTFKTTLIRGGVYTPPAASSELFTSSAAPVAAGSALPISFQVTEKDAFLDDKGSARCNLTLSEFSVKDQPGSCIVSVVEGSKTALFEFSYRVTFRRRLFQQLWLNHPAIKGVRTPCATGGTPNYDNQCAIRMGISLLDSGISLSSFGGAYCWHGHGKRHVLRAQELANWIDLNAAEFGKATKRTAVTHRDYQGQMGVVFFKNFWGEGNQGDHIDLWDGTKMGSGSNDYFQLAQEVWFWRL